MDKKLGKILIEPGTENQPYVFIKLAIQHFLDIIIIYCYFTSEQTPIERLAKQIKKLWEERDFRTLTIESLEKGESSGKKESKADDKKTTNLAAMKNIIRASVAYCIIFIDSY